MPSINEYITEPCPITTELNLLYPENQKLTIFDVGACEGEDSIRYANMYPSGKIYCFEPLPNNFEKVKQNIVKYQKNNIQPYCLAMSDANGTGEFHVSSGRPEAAKDSDNWDYGNKSSSLLPPDKVKDHFEWLKFNEVITVETATLADFCKKEKINSIDLIHMDVQGAELKVLSGAKDFLHNIKAIWLEVEAVRLYERQPIKSDIESFMATNNFIKAVDNVDGVSGDQLYVHSNYFNSQWISWNFKPRRLFKKLFSA